jgi:hypothetical protein
VLVAVVGLFLVVTVVVMFLLPLLLLGVALCDFLL